MKDPAMMNDRGYDNNNIMLLFMIVLQQEKNLMEIFLIVDLNVQAGRSIVRYVNALKPSGHVTPHQCGV